MGQICCLQMILSVWILSDVCITMRMMLCHGFDDVYSGVGRIPGDYSLSIDPQIPPVALTARPLSAALREATEKKLDELEAEDIITKIPVSKQTAWCLSITCSPKKSSNNDKMQVRITIDPQQLNKACKRKYHPITTYKNQWLYSIYMFRRQPRLLTNWLGSCKPEVNSFQLTILKIHV